MPTTTIEDAVFADLAERARYDDQGAARELRRLLLPACERIAGTRGDHFLAAVVDAAYAEVIDWAAALRTATCRGG